MVLAEHREVLRSKFHYMDEFFAAVVLDQHHNLQ